MKVVGYIPGNEPINNTEDKDAPQIALYQLDIFVAQGGDKHCADKCRQAHLSLLLTVFLNTYINFNLDINYYMS